MMSPELIAWSVTAVLSAVIVLLGVNVLLRRKAERRLGMSEARYRSLFESSRDGIAFVDLQDRIVEANPALLQLSGYPEGELHGTPFRSLVQGSEEEDRRTTTQVEMAEQGFSEEREKTFIRQDGTPLPVTVRATTSYHPDGSAKGAWWIVRDMTARHEAQAALRDSEEQLRHSQKLEAVGRLAGGVAHDFNNLLTSILGFSALALEQVEPDGPVATDLEEVVAAAERAKDLTTQLLMFSQKGVTDIRPLDLNAVVMGMDGLLRRALGEDIELVTVLHAPPGIIKADAGQLEQIVMNLAVNARDAMPQGGTLRIETASVVLEEHYTRRFRDCAPGPYVMLRVSDTGVGMTDETRQRAFEPFFSTKNRSKGSGLGLSTVYGIMRHYKGIIDLDTSPEQGTRFTFYFPRSLGQDETLPVIIEDEVPSGTETVLVVEDQHSVLSLTRRMLQDAGYQVLTAGQGQDALTLCRDRTEPIDLILTDVVMPKMSGPELVREASRLRDDFRVLYMSGFADIAIEGTEDLKPGTNFVRKPFTRRDLLVMVRQALDRRVEASTP